MSFLLGPKEKLPTRTARVSYLTNLSLIPCLICYLAFTRPAIYRFLPSYKPDELEGVDLRCPTFGWLNNASVRMTCGNRSLDIHATLAISWLTLFTAQAVLQFFGARDLHRKVGKYLGPVALINVLGMLQLSVYDVLVPMVTERPWIFTPFMFATAWIVLGCLFMSWKGLKAKPIDIDAHSLWMVRAFLMSFTTPVIRFYPIVLRYIFSTECIKTQAALDTWVIGSMTVASTFTLYLFYLANKAALKNPIDKFFLFFAAFEVCALLIDAKQTYDMGFFYSHMYTCWKHGPDHPTLGGAVETIMNMNTEL